MKKLFITALIFLSANVLLANPVNKGLKAYNQGNYFTANKLYKKACDGGNAQGCFNLGNLYNYGQGVKQNSSTAAKLYKKACDGGDKLGCQTYI